MRVQIRFRQIVVARIGRRIVRDVFRDRRGGACAQNHDAISVAQRVRRVVARHQDRKSVLVGGARERIGRQHFRAAIHRREWVVEAEQRRPRRDALRDGEARAMAA